MADDGCPAGAAWCRDYGYDRAALSPGTHYRTIDHLGSTRLVTDQNQTDKARYASA